MAKRADSREAAKAEYLEKRARGERVKLKEIALRHGVSYQTIRNWRIKDGWDDEPPKQGAPYGNQNCKGHRNAAGHHHGPPKGNKNAEKDGAYSAVFFDMLSDEEKELIEQTPLAAREALEHELKILKFREHKIMTRIAYYENQPEDGLHLSTLMDVRKPGSSGADGEEQESGMYMKDSTFERIQKLQEALYKVQGRIAKILDSLRQLEESEKRLALEREKLEIMRMRATGAADFDIPLEDLEPEALQVKVEDTEGESDE